MRFSYVHEHGSQTDVRVSFHTPGVTSPEAPTLLLLGRVLDDGLSTRVHQTICEDRGLAYEAFAGNDAFEDCGVFEFGASVEHKKAPVLVQTVFELIDELRRHPPTKDEVEKGRVAPGDIQQAVQRYLDPENAYLTCVGVLDDGLLSDVRTLAGA
ncbi:MAG: insulinase family protein [Deltaproteobacteria bacterium]|nr:insulinase family protein [Deltaproteobacteria bacterium]